MANMKYNETEMKHYALSDVSITKQGLLWKKGERTRDGYLQRHFILKGNLLFYAKPISGKTPMEPIGCVVLERVSVALEGKPEELLFKLEFDGPNTRVYHLKADTEESRTSWMETLRVASYEYLRDLLLTLREQYKRLCNGKDPLEHAVSCAVSPEVRSFETKSAAQSFKIKRMAAAAEAEDAQPGNGAAAAASPSASTNGNNSNNINSSLLVPPPSAAAAAAAAAAGAAAGSAPTTTTTASTATSSSSSSTAAAAAAAAAGLAPLTMPPGGVAMPIVGSPLLELHPLPGTSPMEGAAWSTLSPMGGPLAATPCDKRGALELALGCRGLKRKDSTTINPYVVIELKSGDKWTEYNKTETTRNTTTPTFAGTCSFDATQADDSVIRLSVYSVDNLDDDDVDDNAEVPLPEPHDAEGDDEERVPAAEDTEPKTRLLGQAQCTLAELRTCSFRELELRDPDGENAGIIELEITAIDAKEGGDAQSRHASAPVRPGAGITRGGNRNASVRNPAHSSDRFNFLLNTVKKHYNFPSTTPDKIKVNEYMGESPFTFSIPVQVMRLFIDDDKQQIMDLEALGTLLGPVEQVRRRYLELLFERQQALLDRIAFLDSYHKTTFKPSQFKKKKNFEMYPTNLHLQSMRVEFREQTFTYDTVTHGAATAHPLGFKSGGLTRIMDSRADIMNQIEKGDGKEVKRTQVRLDKLRLTLLARQTKLSSELAALINASATGAETTKISDGVRALFKELQGSVEDFITFMSSEVVKKAMLKASESRPVRSAETVAEYKQAAIASKSGGSIPLVISGQTLEVSCEDLTRSVHDTFAALEKAFNDRNYASLHQLDNMFRITLEHTCLEVKELLYILKLNADLPLLQLDDLTDRQDIVFSQAITQLITSFCATFKTHHADAGFTRQIAKIGFLVHFESLLSTHGDEMGMLEDMFFGIKMTAATTFKIVDGGSQQTQWFVPRLMRTPERERYTVNVNLMVPTTIFARLTDEVRSSEIRVHPVMFSMGVNEMQTIANKIGETEMQERINDFGFDELQKYAAEHKKFWNEDGNGNYSGETMNMDSMFTKLRAALALKRTKNVDVLTITEEIVRYLKGGRLTCCKSGKDRTAMLTTLEQCNILVKKHFMMSSLQQQALDAMRSVGTRRENVKKNIGDDRYAFNKLQVFTLPKQLRPPVGSYGAAIT